MIHETKKFKLRIPHGWIGLGTRHIPNIGPPHHTSEAWMIDTGGNLVHNNVETNNKDIQFANREVEIVVDVPKSEITIDGVTQKMGDNCPKPAYFVISTFY